MPCPTPTRRTSTPSTASARGSPTPTTARPARMSKRTDRRNRSRVWSPALQASAIGFNIRIQHLRHAPANRLSPSGSNLRSVWPRGRLPLRRVSRFDFATPCACTVAATDLRPRKRALTCANTSPRGIDSCSSLTSRVGFWPNSWGYVRHAAAPRSTSNGQPNSTRSTTGQPTVTCWPACCSTACSTPSVARLNLVDGWRGAGSRRLSWSR